MIFPMRPWVKILSEVHTVYNHVWEDDE
jgi:hypothetical protein